MTSPWYKNGLRFACTQCGKCCTGSPGYVWIDEEEVLAMALFLRISEEEFRKRYTRQVNGKISLLEYPKSYDCIFLRDKRCLVYGARPKQCRRFPFWPENLESKEAWKKAKSRCEGIDHPHAPLISLEQIQSHVDETPH